MPAQRVAFAVTVCVLLERDGRWLLSVRSADAAYAPGAIGLVGGHVELGDGALGVLEAAARREVREETGLDLEGKALSYVESVLLAEPGQPPQLSVTFRAPCPPDVQPRLGAGAELSAVGWWSLAELRDDPRCSPWLLELLARVS